jgi:hypothetical protein
MPPTPPCHARHRRSLAVARTVLATAALLASSLVPAQTQAPIPAPGMPAYGLPYGNYFAALKAKLKLSAEQDAQYAVALKATNKANDTLRKVRDEAAKALRAELAKPEPDFGKVLAQGTPDQIRDHPAVIEAYLGVPAESIDDHSAGGTSANAAETR